MVAISVVSGTAIGLLISYIILRITRRPWPYSISSLWHWASYHLFAERGKAVYQSPVLVSIKAKELPEPVQSLVAEQVSEPFKNRTPLASENLPRTKLILEIESNLYAARTPRQGMLKAFQTEVLDSEKSIDILQPEVQVVIKVAYKDMRLANCLVALSSSNSEAQQSVYLYRSYAGLCSKIAENLEQAISLLVDSHHKELQRSSMLSVESFRRANNPDLVANR